MLYFLSACAWDKEENFIEEADLQKNIKIDEVVALRKFLKTERGTLCVLFPYQEDVVNSKPYSDRINNYLKKINYVADEGHWAFVFVNDEIVKISKIKRSEKLDIMGIREINSIQGKKLPVNFLPTNCVSVDKGLLWKIKINERVFLILGESK
jgi:hypothetical protein